MVDHFENKANKDNISFHFFDMDKKVIIDSLNMVTNGKVFLQAVNFSDRVFLIQRECNSPKV
jgi:hypothetical protein